MEIGTFKATRAARTADPRSEAQEQAARGNWRPTDQILKKADPDYIQRWLLLEARKIELRKLYQRATLITRGVENGTSKADRLNQQATDFWTEYASLDDKWIGDHQSIKESLRRDNGSI